MNKTATQQQKVKSNYENNVSDCKLTLHRKNAKPAMKHANSSRANQGSILDIKRRESRRILQNAAKNLNTTDEKFGKFWIGFGLDKNVDNGLAKMY